MGAIREAITIDNVTEFVACTATSAVTGAIGVGLFMGNSETFSNPIIGSGVLTSVFLGVAVVGTHFTLSIMSSYHPPTTEDPSVFSVPGGCGLIAGVVLGGTGVMAGGSDVTDYFDAARYFDISHQTEQMPSSRLVNVDSQGRVNQITTKSGANIKLVYT